MGCGGVFVENGGDDDVVFVARVLVRSASSAFLIHQVNKQVANRVMNK